MTNEPRFGFALEYVADIETAKHFYVDVLGLEVKRYHPTFVQSDHFALASDTPMTADGKPELYWIVDDAEAAFRDLAKRADVTLAITQKPFGKVFGIRDPDGRPCYLIEFSKDRPSRPA